jgi:hypothetical protein
MSGSNSAQTARRNRGCLFPDLAPQLAYMPWFMYEVSLFLESKDNGTPILRDCVASYHRSTGLVKLVRCTPRSPKTSERAWICCKKYGLNPTGKGELGILILVRLYMGSYQNS